MYMYTTEHVTPLRESVLTLSTSPILRNLRIKNQMHTVSDLTIEHARTSSLAILYVRTIVCS